MKWEGQRESDNVDDLRDHAGTEHVLGVEETDAHLVAAAVAPWPAPRHPGPRLESGLDVGDAHLDQRAGLDRHRRMHGQPAQADVLGVEDRRGPALIRADLDRDVERMPDELPHA